MYAIQESRGPVIPASAAPAMHHYRHSANLWSNNFTESRRAPNYSHAAFSPANSELSSNKSSFGSSFTATKSSAAAAASPKAAKSKEVIAFHSSSKWMEYIKASKQSNKLIVIFFTATWCGPCRSMEPTIKELAAKYTDIDLVKIDVDELFNVSCEYGIQTMPTFLFMKNGKEIDKVAGARKQDLQMKIEQHRA